MVTRRLKRHLQSHKHLCVACYDDHLQNTHLLVRRLADGLQVLYALALIPVGFLADKVDRPRLLSGGLVTWSFLTMAASKVKTCPAHLAPLALLMRHTSICQI